MLRVVHLVQGLPHFFLWDIVGSCSQQITRGSKGGYLWQTPVERRSLTSVKPSTTFYYFLSTFSTNDDQSSGIQEESHRSDWIAALDNCHNKAINVVRAFRRPTALSAGPYSDCEQGCGQTPWWCVRVCVWCSRPRARQVPEIMPLNRRCRPHRQCFSNPNPGNRTSF